LIYTFISYKNW